MNDEIQPKPKKPSKKTSGRLKSWVSKKLPRRTGGFPKAFEGDTYVADLHKAAKARKPWVNSLIVSVALSGFADWYLLTDTLNMALEDEFKIFIFPVMSGFIAAALLVAYLMLGYLAGKNFREFQAFKQRPSFWSGTLLALVEFVVLVFLFFLRLYGEIQKNGGFGGGGLNLSFGGGGGGTLQIGGGSSSASWFADFFEKAAELGPDVFFPAFALSLIMLVGALLEICYAYLSYDPYSGEKKKLAEAYIAEDRQLYERVFFERALSLEKCAEYERLERELDKRAVSSTFKIDSLIAQLNGIVDPADAYDFCAVSKLLDKELSGK